MAFKFVTFAALLAVANAGILSTDQYIAGHQYVQSPLVYAAPVAKTIVKTVDTEFDHHPQYSYSYGVHDSLTGDAKTQQESRNGDVVKGSYSVVDADGTKRTVEYTADDINGFNAVVHKEPAHVAIKTVAPVIKTVAAPYVAAPIVKTVAPVVAAAPVLYKSAQLAYSAPVAPVAYHKVW